MNLPKEITKVLTSLQDAGYEAYCVGGCVRDYILHQEGKDYDITTNASIDEIKGLFEDYSNFNLGKKHSTITIHIGDHFVEITPFKGKTLEEDLQHRDLTINAIAYSCNCGYVNFIEGIKDIENKKISFVKDGETRIKEDPIRMLRAIRFACRYHFLLDKEAKESIKKNAKLLQTVAKERIRDELLKILRLSEEGIYMMKELGVLDVMDPHLYAMFLCEQHTTHQHGNIGTHTLRTLKESYSIDYYFDEFTLDCIRIALLFHNTGKPSCKKTDDRNVDSFDGYCEESLLIAGQFMETYRFSTKMKQNVLRLIQYHNHELKTHSDSVKKDLIEFQLYPEFIKSLLAVQYCVAYTFIFESRKISNLMSYYDFYNRLVSNRPYRIDQLAIDGKDILEAIPELNPKKISEVKKFCLNIIFQYPEKNTKECLMNTLKRKQRRFTYDFKQEKTYDTKRVDGTL